MLSAPPWAVRARSKQKAVSCLTLDELRADSFTQNSRTADTLQCSHAKCKLLAWIYQALLLPMRFHTEKMGIIVAKFLFV